jgi:hypothetical protein
MLPHSPGGGWLAPLPKRWLAPSVVRGRPGSIACTPILLGFQLGVAGTLPGKVAGTFGAFWSIPLEHLTDTCGHEKLGLDKLCLAKTACLQAL